MTLLFPDIQSIDRGFPKVLWRMDSKSAAAAAAAAAAKSHQSCLTLCDPIDCSPPGFPVPGILQARTLEWVAISFSNIYTTMLKAELVRCCCIAQRAQLDAP